MLRILKALIEGLDIAVYSYVKPGAPHRFSTHYLDLHSMVRLLTEAIETYAKAINSGFAVAEGRLGLDKVGLGGLIYDAFSYTARIPAPMEFKGLHLILIPIVVASSYSYKMEGKSPNFISRLNRGMKDILLYTDVNEVIRIYEALKSYGGPYTELLTNLAITRGRIESESMNLLDFYGELGKGDKVIGFFSRKYYIISRLAQKYVELYIRSRDHNVAAREVFSDIALELMNVKVPVRMSSLNDLINLLKVDRELLKKGVNLSGTIPILTSVAFIANLMI